MAVGLKWLMKTQIDHLTKAIVKKRNGVLAYSAWMISLSVIVLFKRKCPSGIK